MNAKNACNSVVASWPKQVLFNMAKKRYKRRKNIDFLFQDIKSQISYNKQDTRFARIFRIMCIKIMCWVQIVYRGGKLCHSLNLSSSISLVDLSGVKAKSTEENGYQNLGMPLQGNCRGYIKNNFGQVWASETAPCLSQRHSKFEKFDLSRSFTSQLLGHSEIFYAQNERMGTPYRLG